MSLLAEGRPVAAVTALLEEVVPLDAERLTEARVWAAFTTPPAATPGIAAIREQVDNGVRELCHNALDALEEFGRLHADRDRRIEIERMHALLDGLTVPDERAGAARSQPRPVRHSRPSRRTLVGSSER